MRELSFILGASIPADFRNLCNRHLGKRQIIFMEKTPIFRFPQDCSFKTIVIKREDLSETGSHKFRYLKPKLEMLKKQDVKEVVLSTTGNAGITAAFYVKKLGVTVTAVMSDRGDMNKAEQIKKNGGTLILSAQPVRTAREIALKKHIPLLRASRDEEAIKGYETLGEELIEQVPNAKAIVNFCTSGTSSVGIMRAYERRGLPLPALYIVQNGRSASIVKTLHPEQVPDNHEQESTGVRDTPRRKELLEWIKKSHGDAWYVTEGERGSAETLLKNYKLETSWEGVSSFAVGVKIAAQYDAVVVIFSGKKWN